MSNIYSNELFPLQIFRERDGVISAYLEKKDSINDQYINQMSKMLENVDKVRILKIIDNTEFTYEANNVKEVLYWVKLTQGIFKNSNKKFINDCHVAQYKIKFFFKNNLFFHFTYSGKCNNISITYPDGTVDLLDASNLSTGLIEKNITP